MSTKMRSSTPEKILFTHGRVLFIPCLALVCLTQNLLASDSSDHDDSKNCFSDVSEVSVGEVVRPRFERDFTINDGELGHLSTLLNKKESASNTEQTEPNQDEVASPRAEDNGTRHTPRNRKTIIIKKIKTYNPLKSRKTEEKIVDQDINETNQASDDSSPLVSPTVKSKTKKIVKQNSIGGRDQVNNDLSSPIVSPKHEDGINEQIEADDDSSLPLVSPSAQYKKGKKIKKSHIDLRDQAIKELRSRIFSFIERRNITVPPLNELPKNGKKRSLVDKIIDLDHSSVSEGDLLDLRMANAVLRIMLVREVLGMKMVKPEPIKALLTVAQNLELRELREALEREALRSYEYTSTDPSENN